MKRGVLALAMALVLAGVGVRAQGPNFAGMWKLNAEKSSRNITGNTPNIAFASSLEVKQTGTELALLATSVRQAPFSATYKLDGTMVPVAAPKGITETGGAKIEGQTLVINTKRSFTSPLGETVINFKEVWTVTGNVLTIEKTRIESTGETSTEKAVYDKA